MTMTQERFQRLAQIYVHHFGYAQVAHDSQNGMRVALIYVPALLRAKLELVQEAINSLNKNSAGQLSGVPQIQSPIIDTDHSSFLAIGPLLGESTYTQPVFAEQALIKLAKQQLMIQLKLAELGYMGYAPSAAMVWVDVDTRGTETVASTFLGWESIALVGPTAVIDLREAARLWHFWATGVPAATEISIDADFPTWQRLSIRFRELCASAWNGRIFPSDLLDAIDELGNYHSQSPEEWIEQIDAGGLAASQIRILCDLGERRNIPQRQQRILDKHLRSLTDNRYKYLHSEGIRLLGLGQYSDASMMLAQVVDHEDAPLEMRIDAWRRKQCADGLVEALDVPAYIQGMSIRGLERALLEILQFGLESRWRDAKQELEHWIATLPQTVIIHALKELDADYTYHLHWQDAQNAETAEHFSEASQALEAAQQCLQKIPYRDLILMSLGSIEETKERIAQRQKHLRKVTKQITNARQLYGQNRFSDALSEAVDALRMLSQQSKSFPASVDLARRAALFATALECQVGQSPETLNADQRSMTLRWMLQLLEQYPGEQWVRKNWDRWKTYLTTVALKPDDELISILIEFQPSLKVVVSLLDECSQKVLMTLQARLEVANNTLKEPGDRSAISSTGKELLKKIDRELRGYQTWISKTSSDQQLKELLVKVESAIADAQISATVDVQPGIVTAKRQGKILELAYEAGQWSAKDAEHLPLPIVLSLLSAFLKGAEETAIQRIAGLEKSNLPTPVKRWLIELKRLPKVESNA